MRRDCDARSACCIRCGRHSNRARALARRKGGKATALMKGGGNVIGRGLVGKALPILAGSFPDEIEHQALNCAPCVAFRPWGAPLITATRAPGCMPAANAPRPRSGRSGRGRHGSRLSARRTSRGPRGNPFARRRRCTADGHKQEGTKGPLPVTEALVPCRFALPFSLCSFSLSPFLASANAPGVGSDVPHRRNRRMVRTSLRRRGRARQSRTGCGWLAGTGRL